MLSVERIGHGPPVLFVHGDIVGPSLTWRKQRELAERWRLLIPSRPGFGDSPPLERNDFEVEAPMFAELLGDGAHLVGHSYGAVIALLAAAERPEAVRSLTVSEPGCLRVAAGTPVVDEMIANGKLLFENAPSIPPEEFLQLFRGGAGSAYGTPGPAAGGAHARSRVAEARAALLGGGDPAAATGRCGFPALVLSGGHSDAFEAVCDALADGLSAERAVIPGRGHTVPSAGARYNELLEAFMSAAEGR